jgi:hypothetical protein
MIEFRKLNPLKMHNNTHCHNDIYTASTLLSYPQNETEILHCYHYVIQLIVTMVLKLAVTFQTKDYGQKLTCY